jgi:hypothetical protein
VTRTEILDRIEVLTERLERAEREGNTLVAGQIDQALAQARSMIERIDVLTPVFASLAQLAEVIVPGAVVTAGPALEWTRSGPFDHAVAGSVRNRSVDGVRTPVITIAAYGEDGSIRAASDLAAVLLHELSHVILGHGPEPTEAAPQPGLYTEHDVNVFAAALAEHHEASLNAPLADVLDRLSIKSDPFGRNAGP